MLLSSSPRMCYKSIADFSCLASGRLSFAFLISSNFCIFQQQRAHLLFWSILELCSPAPLYVSTKWGILTTYMPFVLGFLLITKTLFTAPLSLTLLFRVQTHAYMKEIHQVVCLHSKTSFTSFKPDLLLPDFPLG